jgi:hypothetical protein
MKNLKSRFVSLFFGDKFIKKISTSIAAVLFSVVASYIPGAPDVVKLILSTLFDLPQGAALTEAGFVAAVAPIIAVLLDFIVKGVIAKDNNTALAILKDQGVYNGSLDAWVGPKAQEAIGKLGDLLVKN